MYMSKHVTNRRETPQNVALPGMVLNSTGIGHGFEVTPWVQLERFLILGSENGTYYATERDLTVDNCACVERCIKENPARTVETIAAISDSGRAAKNDFAVFALAMVAGSDNPEARKLALAALPRVARTGTHLFHFLDAIQSFRGWGRGLRTAVGNWYTQRSELSLAQQLFKYQGRDGWTHRDVLRLAHVAPQNMEQESLFGYAVHGTLKPTDTAKPHPAMAWANAAVEVLNASSPAAAAKVIADYKLPREVVPTQLLNHGEVWEALLPHMGLTALVRNLNKMTIVGVLAPLASATEKIAARLTDTEALRSSRIHPVQLLLASRVYGMGHGVYGSLTWRPVPVVVDALEAAFYASFANVTPSNKRFMLGVDVSGSMGTGTIAGAPGITPRVAAAVMAMVTARTEPKYDILGFDRGMRNLGIRASSSLEEVVKAMSINNGGGTDCSVAMSYALEHKLPVDVFAIYTDNETWAGTIHPHQALKKYRERTGIPAKLVVVATTSTRFSIADPSDSGMLDVVGFDAVAPQLISDFAR